MMSASIVLLEEDFSVKEEWLVSLIELAEMLKEADDAIAFPLLDLAKRLTLDKKHRVLMKMLESKATPSSLTERIAKMILYQTAEDHDKADLAQVLIKRLDLTKPNRELLSILQQLMIVFENSDEENARHVLARWATIKTIVDVKMLTITPNPEKIKANEPEEQKALNSFELYLPEATEF